MNSLQFHKLHAHKAYAPGHTHTHACMHTHAPTHTHTHTDTYKQTHTHASTHTHACTCTHTHAPTHTHTHTDTYKQTHTHANTHTHTCTNTHSPSPQPLENLFFIHHRENQWNTEIYRGNLINVNLRYSKTLHWCAGNDCVSVTARTSTMLTKAHAFAWCFGGNDGK